MDEKIELEVNNLGRLVMSDKIPPNTKTELHFTTPNSDGIGFNLLFKSLHLLFKSLREGDRITVTFHDVKVCKHCGSKLTKKRKYLGK